MTSSDFAAEIYAAPSDWMPMLAAWCDEQKNGYAAAVRLWDVDY